jgi:pilus assembly protein CpaF
VEKSGGQVLDLKHLPLEGIMTATHAEVSARARVLTEKFSAAESLDRAIDEMARQRQLTNQEQIDLALSANSHLSVYGSLQPYADDESIEEIWLNRPNEIFVSRAGLTERIFLALSAEDISVLVERLLRHSGRRLDRSSPFVDAALVDGSRLHVIIPDIAREHWSVNIRKFPKQIWRLAQLVEKEVLTLQQARFLSGQIRASKNILVSGATQAGKTTMLCALIAETNPAKRLVTVEETFEIRAVNFDWVALQTRQANLEGRGEVTLRRLVKESLRMRPELLIVGEVREAESLDMLIALNSGLPGLCTIHANSAAEAVQKLCTLPLLAGSNISADFVKATVGACIDIVVHCEMQPDGKRKVREIAAVSFDNVKQTVAVNVIEMGSRA